MLPIQLSIKEPNQFRCSKYLETHIRVTMTFLFCQIYWQVRDPLSPRYSAPYQLGDVLSASAGQATCLVADKYCNFTIPVLDSEVLNLSNSKHFKQLSNYIDDMP